MSLYIYRQSGGIGQISTNDSYAAPLAFSISQDGAILEQRIYLRSDNPLIEGFADGQIFARDAQEPEEAWWITFADDVNGAAGSYQTTLDFTIPVGQELPIWIKIDIPGGQEQGLKTDIKIITTYTQVDA